jgi:hypothetical protein
VTDAGLVLEVRMSAWKETRLVEEPIPTLAAGQVLFRVDRFALTANNVSYALSGDVLGYRRFFPCAEGSGRIPAMGFAEVIRSRHPEVKQGTLCFGFYPMGRHLLIQPGAVSAAQSVDEAPHRARLRALPAHHEAVARPPLGCRRSARPKPRERAGNSLLTRAPAQRTPETQTTWRWGESGANPSLPVQQGKYRELSRIQGLRGASRTGERPVSGHLRRDSLGPEQGTTARRSGSFPPGTGKPTRLVPGERPGGLGVSDPPRVAELPAPRLKRASALAPRPAVRAEPNRLVEEASRSAPTGSTEVGEVARMRLIRSAL